MSGAAEMLLARLLDPTLIALAVVSGAAIPRGGALKRWIYVAAVAAIVVGVHMFAFEAPAAGALAPAAAFVAAALWAGLGAALAARLGRRSGAGTGAGRAAVEKEIVG